MSVTSSSTPPAPPRVAVATSAAVPHLDSDGPELLAALARAGVAADVRVWDAPDADWSEYDLVLVRSTWDYTGRRDEFLAWARSVAATSNPADVLEWNTDKHYVLDLERAGVPVVPTLFLEAEAPFAFRVPAGAGEVVVKPAVSAGATDTGRFAVGDAGATELARHLHGRGRTVMVQPYQSGIDAAGETAVLFLGGEFSHVVRKAPLLTGPGVGTPAMGDDVQDRITVTTPTTAQLAVARAALEAVPGGAHQLTYARVDLVPGADGEPLVLELEVSEPSLFLRHAPAGALDRFARSVAAAATGRVAVRA
ncbi:glutathione synthase/RimK-type ligase-like ATP-grasp enzyme [Kineococcus xinjiangensis]|uniref:Glutathione synthase/RimK-type ligase-like ATP-grasp enzyme n=1 Tax=Kineococcus xinjiangensis TaxID=512762 RepID=A0A2S6IEH3_9ACTN|nr:hypothetical protein [Kineococcus xinjiangensis]PPK92618.1 glutathione synthase/RimK-type ligase-like ATP-grasp enzyme [Kineococcus xinjiangensis]